MSDNLTTTIMSNEYKYLIEILSDCVNLLEVPDYFSIPNKIRELKDENKKAKDLLSVFNRTN